MEKAKLRNDVFELLQLRFQWEETVHGFTLPADKKQGTVDNIKYYLAKGHTLNRFREGHKQSIDIGNQIMEKANEQVNLSGLHGYAQSSI